MQQGEPGATGEEGPAGPKVRASPTQSYSTALGSQREVACPWSLEGEEEEEHSGPRWEV